MPPTKGTLTSGYGSRWGVFHFGIDVANAIGTPILAAADGVVAESGPASGFGLWVRILHTDGTTTIYGHINRSLVTEGQKVLFRGVARLFGPIYRHHLVAEWIPALDGVEAKLHAGAQVADVGCGHGVSTVTMARAFPASTFLGLDYHEPSIHAARKTAAEAGVSDRARFEVAASTALPCGDYDLICFFDCLHDMGDPVGAAAQARTALADEGTVLLVEPQAGDTLTENINHGLATPLGFISEVGVAGLTLGGGLGYLTRRFGWTVDNLLEVEIVTADGQVRRASRDEHADLFWAIRGAGANLGVVTSFTFRLHQVGPTVYGGLIAWPFERAEEILQAYRAITTEAPRELAVWLNLIHAPPEPFVPEEWHGKKICAMAVCYSGDLDHVDKVLAPIRALGDPIVDLLAEQPYTQVQSYLDATEPKGMHYYWKTAYCAELNDDLLSTVRDSFAECPIPGAELGFLHLGGALNEHGEDDGAVGNRDAHYVLGANGMWEPDEPHADEFRQWIRDSFTRQRPFSTGRTYINFQTADEDSARVRATYGINYDRLVELKKIYDPTNLFRSNCNIPPAPDGQV